MKFFSLICIFILSSCVSAVPQDAYPSPGVSIKHSTFQRRLNLREHSDSNSWQRIFTKGYTFVVLEPGFSHIRVGDKVVGLRDEIRLWDGNLYLPKESVSMVDRILREIDSQVLSHPEWIPVSEKSWKYIVIHHSAINVGNAAIYHQNHLFVNKWTHGLGYHFVIGNGSDSGNGEVEVGPRWHKQLHGAHARSGEGNIYNLEGIGICLVGDFDQNGGPTEAQLSSLTELTNFLRRRYNISLQNIVPHHEVPNGTVTKCPGDNFPWRYFKSTLK